MQINAAACLNLHVLYWQGRQDSNLRPSVLETDALPTELHPYRRLSIADRFAFVTPFSPDISDAFSGG